MSEQQTRTLWQKREAPLDDMAGGWHILRGDPLKGVYSELYVCRCDDKDEAELIVRAVNAHDELVAACEAAEACLLRTDPPINRTCLLAKLEAALNKAKQ